MIEACLIGVVTCNGTDQVQVVLDLMVAALQAVLVQRTVVNNCTSLG